MIDGLGKMGFRACHVSSSINFDGVSIPFQERPELRAVSVRLVA
jgi:hypothetical protein